MSEPKRLFEGRITTRVLIVATDYLAAHDACEKLGDDFSLDGEVGGDVDVETIDNDRRRLLDHELDVQPHGLADGDGRTVGQLIAAGAIVILDVDGPRDCPTCGTWTEVGGNWDGKHHDGCPEAKP